jgi:magnesium-transporting ATPase (P-type)
VYRSSPDEKAIVVIYIMSNFDVFTLAIGDGANDVNML